MDRSFVKVDEKEKGPVSVRELRSSVMSGKAQQDVFVWDEDLQDWVSSRRFTDIGSPRQSSSQKIQKRTSKIIAIASGKGGVGKSVLSCSLGVGLAATGSDVVLVDGDLAGPNLHMCMGISEPEYTFFDFYTSEKNSLSEIILETSVPNLGLISGACGTLGVANPKYFQKRRFMRELQNLSAEYVILDLGAGASYNVVDFFLLAEDHLLVATPEPTSIQESFNFIKICVMRELTRRLKEHAKALETIRQDDINRPGKAQPLMTELLARLAKIDSKAHKIAQNFLQSFRPQLLLNMVRSRSDLKEGIALQTAASELLSVEVGYLGCISFDARVGRSVRALKPFLLLDPKSRASRDMSTIIRSNLLGRRGFREIWDRRNWQKQIAAQLG